MCLLFPLPAAHPAGTHRVVVFGAGGLYDAARYFPGAGGDAGPHALRPVCSALL